VVVVDNRGYVVTALLNAREVGEWLGLSPATVLDMFEDGRLPGYRIGGRKGGAVRFNREDVQAVLEGWRCGPAVPAGRLEVVG